MTDKFCKERDDRDVQRQVEDDIELGDLWKGLQVAASRTPEWVAASVEEASKSYVKEFVARSRKDGTEE